MGNRVSTAFCGILYPEDKTHEQAIKRLEKTAVFWGWKYFYILHDKDKWSDDDEKIPDGCKVGDKKKAHWHIVIVTSDRKSPKTIAKMIKVEENRVQVCDGLRGYLQYLCHINDDDKYQYSTSDVVSNDNYMLYTASLSSQRAFDDSLGLFLGLVDEMGSMGLELSYTAVLIEGRTFGLGKWLSANHQMVSKVIEDKKREYGQR